MDARVEDELGRPALAQLVSRAPPALANLVRNRPVTQNGQHGPVTAAECRSGGIVRPVRAVLRVLVVAAPRLPAQPAGRHHPGLDRVGAPARLAERELLERLRDLE